MEKLLHERLREWAPDGYKSFTGDDMLALADEIERCYIPRPRFEDGEPIKAGDDIDRGTVWTFVVTDEGKWVVNLTNGDGFNQDKYGDYLKRPQPKVLDADGVEIKVGDTVWDNNGRELTVTGFMGEVGIVEVRDGTRLTCCMNTLLTHKEPVLDADGVPINVGDTVWHTEDSERGEVILIENALIKVHWENGDHGYYNGIYLTHKEPDSLFDAISDMREYIELVGCPAKPQFDEWLDRLSALIEEEE